MEDFIIKIMVELTIAPGALLYWYLRQHNKNIQLYNPHKRKLNKWELIWRYKDEMQARELQTELMRKQGLIDDKGKWIG